MYPLPYSNQLPVGCLQASFDNVTNSYKFYWFLAILEHLRETQSPTIAVDHLLARMVALAWFPAYYFRLSFGKQDRLGQIALELGEDRGIQIDTRPAERVALVQEALAANSPLAKEGKSLSDYVPYRFLRPFFFEQTRGLADWSVNEKIKKLADEFFLHATQPCPYRLIDRPIAAIEIHPAWYGYFNDQMPVLTGFCLWHLTNYIQKNNPNVPNVSHKLFAPEKRDLKNARSYWKTVLETAGGLPCIYSGIALDPENFSLDHFLPWRFVSHDLLWNIIPAPRHINSAKNDRLPDLEKYFEPFARQQYLGIQIISKTSRKNLLDDFINLYKVSAASEISAIEYAEFAKTLHETIAPQYHIAHQLGFLDWRYAWTA